MAVPARPTSPPPLCLLRTHFFFDCHGDRRDLHSFPTRRSSDLGLGDSGLLTAVHLARHAGSVDIVGVSSKPGLVRSEEHTSNSSHVEISYAVSCLKKKSHRAPAGPHPTRARAPRTARPSALERR